MSLMQIMARPAGIEPTTPWFVAKYSIQLSYGREERNYNTRKELWGRNLGTRAIASLLGAVEVVRGLMDLLPQRLALLRRQLGWTVSVIAVTAIVGSRRAILSGLGGSLRTWPLVPSLPAGRGQPRPLRQQQHTQAQRWWQKLHLRMAGYRDGWFPPSVMSFANGHAAQGRQTL